MNPETVIKGLKTHVLRNLEWIQFEVKRGEEIKYYSIPVEEPRKLCTSKFLGLHGGADSYSDGLNGTVYARSPKGSSTAELE
jgi:hypothetical protein